jgi:hypothetical protein
MSANQLQEWDDKISALTQRILGIYEPPEFNTLRQLSDQAGAETAAQAGTDPALRHAVTIVCDALVLNLRLVEKIREAKELREKPKLFQNHADSEITAILTQPAIAVTQRSCKTPASLISPLVSTNWPRFTIYWTRSLPRPTRFSLTRLANCEKPSSSYPLSRTKPSEPARVFRTLGFMTPKSIAHKVSSMPHVRSSLKIRSQNHFEPRFKVELPISRH